MVVVKTWYQIYIGYCGIKPFNASECYLIRAGVAREFQGQGLQKKMIRLRTKWAMDHNYSFVATDTSLYNFASINSLIACKFKMFHPECPWAGDSQLYWYKELKK